jgi:hypothetical protein
LLTSANNDELVKTRFFGAPLISYLAPIPAVAFGPSSSEKLESLVAVGRYREDFAVYIWEEVSRKAWEQEACRIAHRNLTQAEWNQYIGEDRSYCRICTNFKAGIGAPSDAPGCGPE